MSGVIQNIIEGLPVPIDPRQMFLDRLSRDTMERAIEAAPWEDVKAAADFFKLHNPELFAEKPSIDMERHALESMHVGEVIELLGGLSIEDMETMGDFISQQRPALASECAEVIANHKQALAAAEHMGTTEIVVG
jgi:hypothetical protein